MLRVSPSEIAKFRRCRRSWWLTYRERWTVDPSRSAATSVALLGTRIHAALEAYYGYDIDPIGALHVIYDNECARRPECEDELNAERAWALTMVGGYVQWAAENGVDEEYEVIATERTIDVPILMTNGEMAIVTGKLDQVVRRRMDGAILLRDWKPQPLSEPVLTPTGWVRMGDISPGDMVRGAHGEWVKVLNVYDRGVDDVYKVTLNDGTAVRATADHPWLGKLYATQKEQVIQTSDLRPGSRIARYSPTTDDAGVDLPVDPYLLGAWIANGHRNGTVISDGSQSPLLATGMKVRERPRQGRKLQYEAVLPPDIQRALEGLALLGKYSGERFIPDVYLHEASYRQRLALLRGLMDGDGCFNPKYRSSAYYSTVSAQLAKDVAALVRSLGGWAKVWTSTHPTYTGSVERRVIVRSSFNPFKHTDHATTWPVKRAEVTARAADGRSSRGLLSEEKIVKSVVPDGREEVRCIEVDSDEHLYVTSGYTVTHNTVGTLHKADALLLDEQMRVYSALLTIASDGMRVDGALYAMLLRSKRTSRSTGPYYEQVHISYNGAEHMSMLERLRGTLDDMNRAIVQLSDGISHHRAVYPSPITDRCMWDCPFKHVCPLFDDGSRASDAMRGNFLQGDPYAYRNDNLISEIKEAFRGEVA